MVECVRPRGGPARWHTSIFADHAKADIHRHADGLPRLVNALCYRSILYAAAHDIKIIDSSNIVTDDLFD